MKHFEQHSSMKLKKNRGRTEKKNNGRREKKNYIS